MRQCVQGSLRESAAIRKRDGLGFFKAERGCEPRGWREEGRRRGPSLYPSPAAPSPAIRSSGVMQGER